MKVIKKGRPQRGWSKEFKCTGEGNGGGGCGAVLLVSEYDIYKTSSSSYGDGTTYYYTFCCPECGVETDIPMNVGVDPKGKRPSEEERRDIALKIKKQ